MIVSGNQFNEGDKAIIREIAAAVGNELRHQIKEDIETAVKLHQADCAGIKAMQADMADLKTLATQARGAWKVLAFIAGVVGSVGTWIVERMAR